MKRTYKDITYTLKQSRRKTLSIYIEADSSISVLAPESKTIGDIEKVIENKRYWVYKELAEKEMLNADRVKRDFVNGQGFLYLGKSYRLSIVDTQDMPLKLMNGYFCLWQNAVETAEKSFIDFYRQKGLKKFAARVRYYQEMLGVRPAGVRVLDLKTRWASCSEDKTLNFHWKTMMAPMKIIDYVVVHELVHLIYPNHTDAFWNEVDKILPDYAERKEWLKENGVSLDI